MRRCLLAGLLLLAACAPRTALPPSPTGLTTVAVAAVENRTGNHLVVSGEEVAYEGAARDVARALVDGWRPGQ